MTATESTTRGAKAKLSLPLVALQKAMAIVAPAIERKTTIPVLSSVRVEQTADTLEFAATNLDLTIRVRVGVRDADKCAPFLLPALKLESFARLLQGDEATFSVADERATLRCGKSTTKMPSMPIASFPALKLGDGETGASLTQAQASRLLHFTTFAITEKSEQYTLNGALLEIAGNKMSVVATDGHRLARYSIPTEQKNISQLFPAAFLKALDKTVDDSKPALLILHADEETVYANVGDRTGEIALSHRRMTGQFPNYRAVMPGAAVATFIVDAEAMKAALRRVMAFTDEQSGCVRLTFAPGELSLNGASKDSGSSDETVDLGGSSEFTEFKIGFNGGYLLDAFSRLSGEVQMRFTKLDGQTAVLIYAEPQPSETFEYVVMPQRV